MKRFLIIILILFTATTAFCWGSPYDGFQRTKIKLSKSFDMPYKILKYKILDKEDKDWAYEIQVITKHNYLYLDIKKRRAIEVLDDGTVINATVFDIYPDTSNPGALIFIVLLLICLLLWMVNINLRKIDNENRNRQRYIS